MKLATKTSLNFLSISLFTFLFGIIALYYTLRFQVDRFINNELNQAKSAFFEKPDSLSTLGDVYLGACRLMPLKSVSSPRDTLIYYTDTLIFDQRAEKYLPFRQMTFTTSLRTKSFKVQILRPLEETDNLIINTFLMMTALVILLIAALLISNQYSSKQIWKDFYISLEKINRFDLDMHNRFDLPETDIQEFEDLNTVLERMSKRIANDYFRMKEYTENASHEIQTPLAIINSKLELMMQSEDLPEKQFKIIAEATEAANRLSRLNKTLILLTRIENRQFPEIETVYPQNIIARQLYDYDDIIKSKEIKLSTHFEADVKLQINPYLSEILFLNLIKNAIRHNIQGGEIEITLSSQKFEISNNGASLNFDPEKLFHRFYKNTHSDKSLGLGLAIVKKITEIFAYRISYFYQNQKHHILLEFK